MRSPTLLVVAKAPEPGRAKTRLAARTGAEGAATFAAAAFLDTLDAAAATGWPVVLAMAGDLDHAVQGAEIAAACAPHRTARQRGDTFAERLVHAHADADAGEGVVQIGTDTPQVTSADLVRVADLLVDSDAVLGHAEDGGWWALGVREPRWARVLVDVPMSRPDTGARTYEALVSAGARVAEAGRLADVDTWEDALELARTAPGTRAARVVQRIASQREPVPSRDTGEVR
ncbi:TIGR04282 family arsenosugar biosynthesis glycosyltransferase [Mumia qirimensis]|uniref:TIGR04282 family arsenosugar biosynthesis glycosyltransferase n=1 Tax=Mumia qirimensis TaxID=3234852 RepID=UPI00351CBCF3